jgi:hypothetical protein
MPAADTGGVRSGLGGGDTLPRFKPEEDGQMRVHVLIAAFVAVFVLTEHASAQLSFSGIPYGRDLSGNGSGLPSTQQPGDVVQVGRFVPFTQSLGFSLPLSDFASQQDLNSTQTQLGTTQNSLAQLNANTQNSLAQLNNTLGQLSNTQNQIMDQINQNRSSASQGIALAGAMTIIPPNPGDRFSLTFSGAGFDSQGAGAVSGSYRVAERVLLFAGYGRSSNFNFAKGGVSFSFP